MRPIMPCTLGPASAALFKAYGESHAAEFAKLDKQRDEIFNAIEKGEAHVAEDAIIKIIDQDDAAINYELISYMSISLDIDSMCGSVTCERHLFIKDGASKPLIVESATAMLPKAPGEDISATKQTMIFYTRLFDNMTETIKISLVGQPLSKVIGFPLSILDAGLPIIDSIKPGGITLRDKQWSSEERADVRKYYKSLARGL